MTERGQNTASSAAQPTPQTMQIVGICGSLRKDSYNRKLLEAAGELAPADADLTLWHRLKEIPPFDEDDEPAPGEAVLALRAAIAQADAVLIATPKYNASLPGQVKNALDCASRPFDSNVLRERPVAVIGASPSRSGAARSQAEARTVPGRIGADVLDVELAVPERSISSTLAGRLRAPVYRRGLSHILSQLATRARGSEPAAAA